MIIKDSLTVMICNFPASLHRHNLANLKRGRHLWGTTCEPLCFLGNSSSMISLSQYSFLAKGVCFENHTLLQLWWLRFQESSKGELSLSESDIFLSEHGTCNCCSEQLQGTPLIINCIHDSQKSKVSRDSSMERPSHGRRIRTSIQHHHAKPPFWILLHRGLTRLWYVSSFFPDLSIGCSEKGVSEKEF